MITAFERFKQYVNITEIGEEITRQELLYEAKESGNAYTTIDQYRNLACKAGYLVKVRNGIYRVVKHLPECATADMVRCIAYPMVSEMLLRTAGYYTLGNGKVLINCEVFKLNKSVGGALSRAYQNSIDVAKKNNMKYIMFNTHNCEMEGMSNNYLDLLK